ncbi:DUF4091 domain-containing protein [Mesoplasma syrphidae]|uniref:DUF4091 domain-containing protein n=1 Tax=Mesoplasma syrphidae TaxID=225999 RepID=A0A2K9BP15_9MOLU|nr:DUF4091 domain-containing protein [Mesoplasma syrphidae]
MVVKKIFIWATTLTVFLASFLGVFAYFNISHISGRNVYLSGFKNQGHVNNNDYHAFFADEADNMALYKPTELSKDINNAKFYGNFDSYKYAYKPDINLNAWKNDNVNTQIVFTNKVDIDNEGVEIKIQNEEELSNKKVYIKYGFNDFVYASKNYNNKLRILNPSGVHETLLVPEKMTEKKVLNNVVANKVNVAYFRILTTPQTEAQSVKIKVNIEKNGTVLTTNTIYLNISEYCLPTEDFETSVFAFSNFSRAANYWQQGQIPKEIKDPTNPLEFINHTWRYLEEEYKYMAQVQKHTSFISNIVPVIDPSNLDKYYWTSESINMSLMEWRRSADGKIYATERSWEALKFYLEKMYEIGMRKFYMQGFQSSWALNSDSFYVYDEVLKKHIKIPFGSGIEGNQNMKMILDQITEKRQSKFIDTPDMEYIIYTDEKSTVVNADIIAWLDEYDKTRSNYKFAMSAWERDIDYSNITKLYNADMIWIYFLDVYNENNANFSAFVKERKKLGKQTGQYFLDADNSFNLTRAEPGINSYLLLALSKENAGHYMKYSLNAWNPKFATWSSDYEERDEYGGPKEIQYLSGDTLLAYPAYSPENAPKQGNIEFIPSVRLEALIQGSNLVKKLNFLRSNNYMSEKEYYKIYENIDIRNKNSKIMSNQKFNLNYRDTSLLNEINKNFKLNSSILKMFSPKAKNDETTAYKVIRNYVDTFNKKG